uniref:Uncharacterized protein n=1 Tax=Anguilla anguilla TaxID=7936 RepID=A0A0E9SQ86_ANGAN
MLFIQHKAIVCIILHIQQLTATGEVDIWSQSGLTFLQLRLVS